MRLQWPVAESNVEENEEELGLGSEVDGPALTIWDIWAIVLSSWRTLLICTVVGLFVGLLATLFITPTFTSKTVVHIAANRGTYIEAGPSVIGNPNMWTHAAYLNTQLQIMRSGDARQNIVSRYEQLRGPQAKTVTPGMLSGALHLNLRRESELVDISVTTKDPQLSADLANITAEVLRDEALEGNIEAARDAKVWLAAQLEEADRAITEANAQLVQYHRDADVPEVGTSQTPLAAQLDSLRSEYGRARTERVISESQLRGYEELYRQGRYIDIAEAVPNPFADALSKSYADAKLEQMLVAQDFLEKMPQRREADFRLQEATRRLKAEVRRILDAEETKLQMKRDKEAGLYKAITGTEESRLDVQGMQEDYLKLKLDLETARETYRMMKDRMQQLQLQANTQLNHIRVVERARPASSSRMRDLQYAIAFGAFGGLLLGGTIVGLREYLDDTIKSPFDIVTYVKVPVVGMVPRVDAEDEVERSLYTHLHPKSPAAEATRALRTYIELNPTGQPPRRLMVTSALSSEGKTSTAIRLAISYANLGRKVVIVDMDLRRPRIHKVFGDARDVGVTSVLVEGRKTSEVPRRTPINGLSYISSGPSTTHPGELLASRELESFLDDLSDLFDMVVIDTPPSVILADSRVVSRHMDAALVVVRDKATSRVPVREAVRGLLLVGANVLGVALNDVDISRAGPSYGYSYRYGYRYGYRYQYAYGYGYGNQPDDQTESAAK